MGTEVARLRTRVSIAGGRWKLLVLWRYMICRRRQSYAMTLSTLAVSILLVLIRSWNRSEWISSSNVLCYGHIDSRLFNNIIVVNC